ARECDVILPDDALSRRHVRLHLAPAMSVEDLGSRNGTRVRGALLERGKPAPLAVGETFQIGRFHLLVAHTPKAASHASASSRTASMRVVDPTATAVSRIVR